MRYFRNVLYNPCVLDFFSLLPHLDLNRTAVGEKGGTLRSHPPWNCHLALHWIQSGSLLVSPTPRSKYSVLEPKRRKTRTRTSPDGKVKNFDGSSEKQKKHRKPSTLDPSIRTSELD